MDRSVYTNGSSPTASTQSVFMVAAIAAAEGRAVAHIDFPGAFLNSPMPDDSPPVFMKLNKFLAKVVVHIAPEYLPFMRADGTLVVKLKKALYGCVESARLWYEHLARDLHQLGYTVNPHDCCVFNRVEESTGKQTTLVIHVDDVMITASSEEKLSNVISEIESIYPDLSIHRGRVIEYIGMKFDFRDRGKVKITMPGYVDEVLAEVDDLPGEVKTPASPDLFTVNESSERLSSDDKERYHSLVAKLLYLAKRVRPDLLVAISFLSKRVQCPTRQDWRKLVKALKYLRGTRTYGIVLEASKHLAVMAWIDAAYGVHANMRSHTGCVIGIGRGPIYAKSSTQKLNTKSSTEAELVGLSDSAGQVLWTRNWLESQGYKLPPAKIYQDNQSTIALIKKGHSTSEKTRHIAIRYFFVADRVAAKEIDVEYLSTTEMLADILTKPLQGALFEKLRDALLNWSG